MVQENNLYDILSVHPTASDVEIRRSYKNLITKAHPDKGGDLEKFQRIQRAYEVLSDASKRRLYDETGKVHKTVDEEFMDGFAGGTFRDSSAEISKPEPSVSEEITIRQSDFQSHTSGFEAWMRTRGHDASVVYTADRIAEQFGVVKSSYDPVPLPSLTVFSVKMETSGTPIGSLNASAHPIQKELQWGEVLVFVKYAPLNLGDMYTVKTSGLYGADRVEPPFTCGHDCVGAVSKVGPGVKSLCEDDWVIPLKPHMGTWRSAAVWKANDLCKVASGALPLQYMAVMREICLAYRLLEDQKSLKPGDCVILNAANSTVGQTVIQLCHLLKLRCVALVRPREDVQFRKLADWLKKLGATEVIKDEGPVTIFPFDDNLQLRSASALETETALDSLKFFSRPKLALDAVGGQSTVRLGDALAQGGEMIIYGCATGKPPAFTWQSWIFREIKVRGFNFRRWLLNNKNRVPPMLESIGKLVKSGKLVIDFTEYDFPSEFGEAVDHAMAERKDTKVLLQMPELCAMSNDQV